MKPPARPSLIDANPLLKNWLEFAEDGSVQVLSGRVELGQGILTAIAQIAAEELGLPLSQVTVTASETDRSANEGYTAGSFSVEMGGAAVRTAAAEAARLIRAEAAKRLGDDEADITIRDGKILSDGAETGLPFGELAQSIDLASKVPPVDGWPRYEHATTIGKPSPRVDLPAKVTGGAFIQDVDLPDMLHARVLRPPVPGAMLVSLDEERVKKLPGVVAVHRDGSFVAVACETEYQAVRALEALRLAATWSDSESLPDIGEWGTWLRNQSSSDEENEKGQRLPATETVAEVSASYSRPLIAHASIGPSCGLAQMANGKLTVWSHTQGVYPLRAALAKALELEVGNVHVIHAQGAGCYGHNGADDAATDAAILALALAPRPVRIQWMRDDELAWSPHGAPMSVSMNGAVTKDGKVGDWTMDIWSGPQTSRPGFMGHPNLMPPAYLDKPVPLTNAHENPMMFMAGDRNAEAIYDLPRQRIVYHKVHIPFRTSSLRSLGAFANVFAIECFMDEMAGAAGKDPVAFRLDHLSDPRARDVLERAAAMAGWEAGSDRAVGVAFSRYKNSAAYAAIVVEVEIGDDIRVSKVWCAVDAGLLVNPDGASNQIEGGIIQSISWTLKEQVGFDHTGITARGWDSYPILRFGEVPEIAVDFMVRPGLPPLGVGEASQGPTAAALANAVAKALGVRVRDLPISRDRLLAVS